MTTAHRPTFLSALGGEDQGGNKMMAPTTKRMVRDAPQEMRMKSRVDPNHKTRAQLLEELESKEAENDGKSKSSSRNAGGGSAVASSSSHTEIAFDKLPVIQGDNPFPEDADADFAKDDASDKDPFADEDSDDDSDSDYEALQIELAKIRKEKEDEQKKKDAEEEKMQEEQRKNAIGEANPLVNQNQSLKRRWDDDTIFKNQTKTAPKVQRRFINDNVRSDFHKKFLNKYVKL